MKQLPKDLMAEAEILSSILYNNKNIEHCIGKLDSRSFYLNKNKIIYEAMIALYKKGIEINIITLINVIGTEKIKKIRGVSYISDLGEGGINTNIEIYIKIIKDKYLRRKLIYEIDKDINELYDDRINIKETIKKLKTKFNLSKELKEIKNFYKDSDLIKQTITDVKNKSKSGGGILGFKTGYENLDRAINGIKKGELFVIGGRPGMGKTVTALNIADGLADNNQKVLFIEMEMTNQSIGMRRISMKSQISLSKIQSGKLSKEEIDILDNIDGDDKISYFTKSLLKMEEIVEIILEEKQRKGVNIVIIDHLGLIITDTKENRVNEISKITKRLKSLAKDEEISIILICQLSRYIEQRIDKRPLLSDLRDSGSIEEDADIVMFVYRDNYYNIKSNCKELEWIIAKQRNGKIGTLTVNYNESLQKIQRR
ncbi:MAG: replicative DNA helicase [Clostridium sp.]